jgi:hypothetical protein
LPNHIDLCFSVFVVKLRNIWDGHLKVSLKIDFLFLGRKYMGFAGKKSYVQSSGYQNLIILVEGAERESN